MCINGETKIIDGTDLTMVYQGNHRFVEKIFLSQTLQCMGIFTYNLVNFDGKSIGKYTIPLGVSGYGFPMRHSTTISLRCLRGHGGVGTDGTAVAQRVDGTSLLDAVKMTSLFGNFAFCFCCFPSFF